MEVKEAVKLAIEHVVDLFELNEHSEVALEEVERINATEDWKVTIGFLRSKGDQPESIINTLKQLAPPKREYKVVHISQNREINSVKIRTVDEE